MKRIKQDVFTFKTKKNTLPLNWNWQAFSFRTKIIHLDSFVFSGTKMPDCQHLNSLSMWAREWIECGESCRWRVWTVIKCVLRENVNSLSKNGAHHLCSTDIRSERFRCELTLDTEFWQEKKSTYTRIAYV